MRTAPKAVSLQPETMTPIVRGFLDSHFLRTLGGWICLLALGAAGLATIRPPQALPAEANAQVFSAARAMRYVQFIAMQPHPLGTLEDEKVRDYLVAELSHLGLGTEIHSGIGLSKSDGSVTAGLVQNIVGRLHGTANSGTVLLAAHYDSVAGSPGAADDGAGVAAIMEAVRALQAGPAPKNDIVVLFTDGEEVGLLGAESFVAQDPLSKSVRVVLNFDNRGDRGPVLMFEASQPDNYLIGQFAKTAPHPNASSLFASIYRKLPNATDFTVLKRSGIAGLNFASGGRWESYHSRLDTAENLDERSLQQAGEYALALARNFGNMDLKEISLQNHNSVFFDLFGVYLVHYAAIWAISFQLSATLLLGLVVVKALKQKEIRFGPLLRGVAVAIACFASVPIGLVGSWLLLDKVLHERLTIGDTTANNMLFSGLAAFGFAFLIWLLSIACRRLGALNMAAAGLIWFAILGLVLAAVLPGGSYLFLWPLLFATAGFWWQVSSGARQRFGKKAAAWLGVAAAIVLFCPLVYLIYLFLGLGTVLAVILGLIISLVGLLLIPLLAQLLGGSLTPRRVITTFGLLGFGFVFIGAGLSHFGPEHPRTNTIVYGANVDDGRAFWISNKKSDAWTSLFLGPHPNKSKLPGYQAGIGSEVFWTELKPFPLAAPTVELLAADVREGIRTLSLRLRSPRQANAITLEFEPGTELLGVDFPGRTVDLSTNRADATTSRRRIRVYRLPEEGVEVKVKVKGPSSSTIRVYDQSSGIANLSGRELTPRPRDVMAPPVGDLVLVSRTYSF